MSVRIPPRVYIPHHLAAYQLHKQVRPWGIASPSHRRHSTRAIFVEALRKLDGQLERIAHVDDSEIDDLEGARDAGMSAFHLQREGAIATRPPGQSSRRSSTIA